MHEKDSSYCTFIKMRHAEYLPKSKKHTEVYLTSNTAFSRNNYLKHEENRNYDSMMFLYSHRDGHNIMCFMPFTE